MGFLACNKVSHKSRPAVIINEIPEDGCARSLNPNRKLQARKESDQDTDSRYLTYPLANNTTSGLPCQLSFFNISLDHRATSLSHTVPPGPAPLPGKIAGLRIAQLLSQQMAWLILAMWCSLGDQAGPFQFE